MFFTKFVTDPPEQYCGDHKHEISSENISYALSLMIHLLLHALIQHANTYHDVYVLLDCWFFSLHGIGDFKGVQAPLLKNELWERLKYILVLLNQVF